MGGANIELMRQIEEERKRAAAQAAAPAPVPASVPTFGPTAVPIDYPDSDQPGTPVPPMPTTPDPGGPGGPIAQTPNAPPTGVSQADWDAFVKKVGNADEAREWLRTNPGDIQRGLTTGTFGSHDRGGAAPARPALPGAQFDDPYTSMLENITKAQMGEVRSNPGLDQLMAFLQSQFTDLSTHPGYSPDEMAVLRTQALEPIEANRAASKQRALEGASLRGFLPSSGIAGMVPAASGGTESLDTAYDRMRTVADRDLAVGAIDRRDADLNKALQLAQLQGLTIPQGQRGEELGLANLLYQLPRTALQDALSVINGTPSSNDAFSQALKLLQETRTQQDVNNKNNAALWASIGEILAGLGR